MSCGTESIPKENICNADIRNSEIEIPNQREYIIRKMPDPDEKITIKDASKWATEYIGKNVTASNISYLINYGRIHRYYEDGQVCISCRELVEYYQTYKGQREIKYTDKIGDDLNWALSFDNVKESETTKHVHRLHPYKGKFIPQLVQYFLDDHVDDFKKEVFFHKGDIVLDPFCGSGTTLVQANELGIHAVGIDVSYFNALISNVKISDYDIFSRKIEMDRITSKFEKYLKIHQTNEFENELSAKLSKFNLEFFPTPSYKLMINEGVIDEKDYGQRKEAEFLPIYNELVDKYHIELVQENPQNFLEKWYIKQIRDEIAFVHDEICKVNNPNQRALLLIILSRTMRSCRATTHSDLATLKDPVTSTYYCRKHGRICKPIFSILKWWKTYTKDTLKRIEEFSRIKTPAYGLCLTGDSRNIDIFSELSKENTVFGKIAEEQKIRGIFTSPPYVGVIDYHEQHAYAYDLFNFERRDELEIGPLYKGQGPEARESYVIGISEVLNNAKRFLAPNYDIFLVANDKYNLYPQIAKRAGMKIVEQFKRPVLNRTERDKGAYSETIFHLKED